MLIAFVIICILLVCIVLIQGEEGDGLGGLFGSGTSATFGSRSGNVITKTTYILVTLFFLSSFGLALVNKAPAVKSLDAAAVQEEQKAAGTNEYWNIDNESPAEAPAEINAAPVPPQE